MHPKNTIDTVVVPVSSGHLVTISPEDASRVLNYRWWVDTKPNGRLYVRGYADPLRARKKIYLHRFIMNAPKGVLVDHVDGDGLHNRRSNLRFADSTLNNANSRARRGTSSGYKGVKWFPRDRVWVASTSFHGEYIHIGRFTDREEAARAYDCRARELFGEFARLNFPDD